MHLDGQRWKGLCSCLSDCVALCVCNYNGPGRNCVAYFEAQFLAICLSLCPRPLLVPQPSHQITNDVVPRGKWSGRNGQNGRNGQTEERCCFVASERK